MKEYFLKLAKPTKQGAAFNLQGAYLSVWDNDIETVLINSIEQATKKGWRSTKPIFENLDIITQESDCDFIITEECANILIAKYRNVKTKIYRIGEDTPFSAAHAIANFITKNGTDPYDKG